jgi:hypothetical protein
VFEQLELSVFGKLLFKVAVLSERISSGWEERNSQSLPHNISDIQSRVNDSKEMRVAISLALTVQNLH